MIVQMDGQDIIANTQIALFCMGRIGRGFLNLSENQKISVHTGRKRMQRKMAHPHDMKDGFMQM